MTVVGVMDGHGVKGHEVTQFLQKQLPIRLQQCLGLFLDGEFNRIQEADDEFKDLLERQRQDLLDLANADPAELSVQDHQDPVARALKEGFLAAQLDARRNSTIPTGRSGTTCVVCAVVEHKDSIVVYTATVGDSGAILASRNKYGMNIQPLTRATTVDMPTERLRIEGCKGRIDGSGNVFYGPVGIAMTRSLGNAVMLPAGVLPLPIVQRFEFSKTPPDTSFDEPSYYICAGTDGVFDVLPNERVIEIIEATVASSGTLQAAANEICVQAKKAWLADLPIEPRVDDITCAIIKCYC
jgi:serine/threonine protein phosphatase PrpC